FAIRLDRQPGHVGIKTVGEVKKIGAWVVIGIERTVWVQAHDPQAARSVPEGKASADHNSSVGLNRYRADRRVVEIAAGGTSARFEIPIQAAWPLVVQNAQRRHGLQAECGSGAWIGERQMNGSVWLRRGVFDDGEGEVSNCLSREKG